ncbi:unnamed protein product [Knipowitschia caucasica]
MPGRKVRKSTGIVKQRRNEDVGLVEELAGAEELTGSEEELAEELTSDTVRVGQKMIDETEKRIGDTEERIQYMEEATCELIQFCKKLKEKQVDQEGRARRDNVRLHGIKEGAEKDAESVSAFVETLLKEKLELPVAYELGVERAHRSLSPRPADGVPPRSIIAKLSSYKCKEDIIKKAWEKKGFVFEGCRVYIDHDYAPEVIKMRKEYSEAKKVLRDKKIRFHTPFPSKFRVFYEGETRLYNSAAEATRDMADRGLQVRVVKAAIDPMENIQRRMWHTAQRAGRQDQGKTLEMGFKEKLQAFRRSSETVQE